MSENLKDVISNLRAIIISFKGALPLANIEGDYQETFGEKVPFKSLGYTSLRDLFEKNSADFNLIGDKVTTVERTNSAHISSLVQRQKKGRTVKNVKNFGSRLRPRNRDSYGGLDYVTTSNRQDVTRPWRQTNGKDDSNDKNGSKLQVKTDSIEKITLRKPRDTKQNLQTSVVPSPLLENTSNLKSVTKTIINEKYSGPIKCRNEEPESLEPFKDVEDLPIGRSAQSRLLKKKYKMLENLKSSEENQNLISKPEPLTVYFDLPPIDSPSVDIQTPKSLPSPSGSSSSTGAPFPTTISQELSATRQKAQARIANIKSSMQANLMQFEVNNNITNNSDFCLSSTGNSIQAKKSFVKTQSDPELDSALIHESKNRLSAAEKTGRDSKTVTSEIRKNDHSCASAEPSLSRSSGDYRKILEDLCKSRGLQKPSYKIIVREPKNEPKHYICKISIGNYLQLSSYPLETRDEKSARNRAIKKMLDYLHMDPSFTNNANVNSNEEETIPRILEIVSPTYGVWSDKLPILYKERFKVDLRKDWLGLVMKTTAFEIDNFDGTRFIIRKKTDANSAILEFPEKTEQHAQPETPTLKTLILPETTYWGVYITNVSSADEIWCRLIGEDFSDAYDDLMTKLELEPPEKKASKPSVGGIYGIKVSAIWYRVKLTELLDESRGMAFYIDVGDKDVVDLAELYEPQEVFFTVAPQAIMLSLHELGSFSDDEGLKAVITENLLGNTYIAEVLAASQDVNDSERKRKVVRLWDTSTERDVNVNQLLLNNIIKNITVPVLPRFNQINEVLVSSVNDNGDVHVQVNIKSVHHLKCLIFNKIKSLEGSPIRRPNDTVGTEIIHLTKCKKSDVFSRVKVIEIQNSTTVIVLFIDYGFVDRIAISDLIHLEKSSILQAIPAQAVKVKLSNLNFNGNILSKLKELLLDQVVLMKVLSTNKASGDSPVVEFFKRSSGGDTLYSVNQKIITDPELKNSDISARRKSVVVGLEKVLPRYLPAPRLPEIGQHFEVLVTSTSSPDLFIVQPVSSRMLLMEMMDEMQTICNGENSPSMSPADFVVGELYAVKHPDGNWYRGCIQAILGSCNYSVFICDFGDCIMVTNDKIQRLPKKFKTIPYQAMRATLCGIPPEHRDWTSVDCINFHKLVAQKYFISVVQEIERYEWNPNYVNLGLLLIDTSGEEDLYIHKVLLEKRNEAFTFIKSSSIS